MTPEQFDKLPKFAQTEITRLRGMVTRLESKNTWLEDANRVKVADSNTIVAQGVSDDTALLPFSQIAFCLTDEHGMRWRSRVMVQVVQDGRSIEVLGDDALRVDPMSSNHIKISLRER